MGCLSSHRGMPSQPYRHEVPQPHRRDPPYNIVPWRPLMLSHQHGYVCRNFGTKRLQIETCHPDQRFRKRGPHQKW